MSFVTLPSEVLWQVFTVSPISTVSQGFALTRTLSRFSRVSLTHYSLLNTYGFWTKIQQVMGDFLTKPLGCFDSAQGKERLKRRFKQLLIPQLMPAGMIQHAFADSNSEALFLVNLYPQRGIIRLYQEKQGLIASLELGHPLKSPAEGCSPTLAFSDLLGLLAVVDGSHNHDVLVYNWREKKLVQKIWAEAVLQLEIRGEELYIRSQWFSQQQLSIYQLSNLDAKPNRVALSGEVQKIFWVGATLYCKFQDRFSILEIQTKNSELIESVSLQISPTLGIPHIVGTERGLILVSKKSNCLEVTLMEANERDTAFLPMSKEGRYDISAIQVASDRLYVAFSDQTCVVIELDDKNHLVQWLDCRLDRELNFWYSQHPPQMVVCGSKIYCIFLREKQFINGRMCSKNQIYTLDLDRND